MQDRLRASERMAKQHLTHQTLTMNLSQTLAKIFLCRRTEGRLSKYEPLENGEHTNERGGLGPRYQGMKKPRSVLFIPGACHFNGQGRVGSPFTLVRLVSGNSAACMPSLVGWHEGVQAFSPCLLGELFDGAVQAGIRSILHATSLFSDSISFLALVSCVSPGSGL